MSQNFRTGRRPGENIDEIIVLSKIYLIYFCMPLNVAAVVVAVVFTFSRPFYSMTSL